MDNKILSVDLDLKKKTETALQEARKLNEEGVKLQQEQKFEEAVKQLEAAIELLEDYEENNAEVKDEICDSMLNIAICKVS